MEKSLLVLGLLEMRYFPYPYLIWIGFHGKEAAWRPSSLIPLPSLGCFIGAILLCWYGLAIVGDQTWVVLDWWWNPPNGVVRCSIMIDSILFPKVMIDRTLSMK